MKKIRNLYVKIESSKIYWRAACCCYALKVRIPLYPALPTVYSLFSIQYGLAEQIKFCVLTVGSFEVFDNIGKVYGEIEQFEKIEEDKKVEMKEKGMNDEIQFKTIIRKNILGKKSSTL